MEPKALNAEISSMSTDLVHCLLVIIQLIGSYAGSGLKHGAHVMVPLKPTLGVVPIDSPSEVSRVNVGCQAVFKAM
jgi:hypothetical protein